jgi:predicted metal-dependent peptidase
MTFRTKFVVSEVENERRKQDARFGDVTEKVSRAIGGNPEHSVARDWYQQITELKDKAGTLTWMDILREEVFELAAEPDSDWERQRRELIQVAAVAVAMVEAGDLRVSQEKKDAARACKSQD